MRTSKSCPCSSVVVQAPMNSAASGLASVFSITAIGGGEAIGEAAGEADAAGVGEGVTASGAFFAGQAESDKQVRRAREERTAAMFSGRG